MIAIKGFAALAVIGFVMLAVLRHRITGRDGIYHCILWLSVAVTATGRGLWAISEGYGRFRAGLDAALAAGRAATRTAWREATHA